MSLRKSIGNMYPWCTHIWGPIAGHCVHGCAYCYMKRYKPGPVRLKEEKLNINLGSGKTIFVCSGTDMFARDVPSAWIAAVLKQCREYDGNTYLFQSKDPWRLHEFLSDFPKYSIFGTTLESDVAYPRLTNAPPPLERTAAMIGLRKPRMMVSIEPIMEFNYGRFTTWLERINPEFVSIGADSKGHKLPEPWPEDTEALIANLKRFTYVRLKKNLGRLLGREIDEKG